MASYEWPPEGSGSGSSGVASLNGLVGTLTLAAGANITITPSGGDTLTIASTGGSPGGADTNIQYNDSGVFGGDANNTWNKTTKLATWTQSSLAATTAAANLLINSSAATSGVTVQVSPAFRWTGAAWKSNATAASQVVSFQGFVRPVTGAAAVSGSWILQKSINGAGFTDSGFGVDSNGLVSMIGFVSTFTGSIQASDSSATPSVNTHLTFLNPAGSQENIYYKFGSTYKAGTTVSSGGVMTDRVTGSYSWQIGADLTASTGTFMFLTTTGLDVTGSISASNKVTAGLGSFSNLPATLNTNGSYSAFGKKVTAASVTLDGSAEFWYFDPDTIACVGTTTFVCSDFDGDSSGCNVHNDAGCTYNSNPCSIYTDESTCTTDHDGCTWNAGQDCHTFDGDQTSCEMHTGCTYDTGDDTCSGTFDSCDGTWPNTCTGTAICSSITNPTSCTNSGCMSSLATTATLPTSANASLNNMSMFYGLKNLSSTGGIVNIVPNSGQTIDGATNLFLMSENDEAQLHFHQVFASCSTFGDQGTCEAQSPCTWTDPSDCSDFDGDQATCEATSGCTYDTGDDTCSGSYGGGCSGQYVSGDVWMVQNIIDNSRILRDSSDIVSIDYEQRELVNASSAVVMDWSAYQLYGSGAFLSLDWNGRLLADSAANTVLDWGSDPGFVKVDGIARVGGTIFSQTSDVTVANTMTETDLNGSGVGTLTLPANILTVGRTVRIAVKGFHSSSGVVTAQVKVKLGSTVILDTGANNSGNDTNAGIEVFGLFTCRTTGGSGTISAQGWYQELGTTPSFFQMVNTSDITIDTTASQAITVTFQWGAASALDTITATNLVVEVLN